MAIDTLKRTLATNFLKRPLQTPSNSIFRNPRFFQFHSFYNSSNISKHGHSLLLIKPNSSLTKASFVSCQSSAHLSGTFQLFDKMPKRSENIEIINYYDVFNLIKFSAMEPNIVTVMIVHSLALKVGALAHLPSSTSLLVNYSRAGDFLSSVSLFSEITYKDVVVWNAMLTASVENECYGDTMKIFAEMIERSLFDSTTIVIVISVLVIANKLIQGCAFHALSVKAGMISDPFLGNALINMYAKCGDLSSSKGMFAGIERRDAISWNSMIASCLHNDEAEESLRYFKDMFSFGKLADNVSLSCAIAACSCLKELDAGQVIRGLGIKSGFDERSHPSVANSLISFYSRCGDVNAAHNTFMGLPHKDVISWNAMIDGFASNGLVREAFSCLDEMQLIGCVQPDTVTVLTVLSLCAELNSLKEGASVHGYIIRRQLGSDLSVTNCLVDMYMKCNRVKEADCIFHDMPQTDLVTWNTMISGYSQNGKSREAQDLFKDLLFWCSKCSLSTVLGVFASCNSPTSLNFGKLIHGWQLKLGFQSNVIVLNSLMFMYINCGDFEACFSLLRRFYDIADTACWNTVIAGCTQSGYYLDSLKTFTLMREFYVSHDSITLVSVISACGNLQLLLEGMLSHGLALKTLACVDIHVQNALITMYGKLQKVQHARLVFHSCGHRNLCSWNCMISALCHNDNSKEALELFSFLDFEPNDITTATILSVCTELGLIECGMQIHGRVFRCQFHTNSFVTAALVDMYSNFGRFDRAVEVFEHSTGKSTAAWNSMISAYGFNSRGQDAIRVFHKMIENGISPTNSTFVSLLSACSHTGLVDEGLRYYDCMVDEYGIKPLTEHHVCLVDLLGRSGRLIHACNFIKQMKGQPEPGLWGALLSACNYHGDVEMGRKVANILFDLDPENVGYYISLSNMYVATGSWSEAVELRSIIKEKGLRKLAGYSLLDVGLGEEVL